MEQKEYFIANIHRSARHPGIVYACLYRRTPTGNELCISADINYVLDAAKERYPGLVEGVDEDKPRGKSTQQTKVQTASILV